MGIRKFLRKIIGVIILFAGLCSICLLDDPGIPLIGKFTLVCVFILCMVYGGRIYAKDEPIDNTTWE